ncbi:MAG: hypothetical protein LBG60_11355 [Bifidobacteriaceae bacterium]|jgi:hypothetical protein|nr:hypothetical protein [Bifidobacteriaceae bacterium]
MTAAAATASARPQPPTWPLRAALHDAVRRPQLSATVGIWLVMSVGFGVGMTYAIYRGAAEDPGADPALVAGLRESFLLANFDATAAGLMQFWGGAVALALGAQLVGSQYAKRTVNLIYTAGPGRLAVLGAQVAALVALLGAATAAVFAANAAGAAVVSAIEGWPLAAPPAGPTALSFATAWLTTAAYGLAGAALAVATRSETKALGIGLVWFLGIETVLIMVCRALGWTGAGQLTLGGATSNLAVAQGAYPWWPNALADQATAGEGAASAAVTAVWLAAGALAAAWLIRHRDI